MNDASALGSALTSTLGGAGTAQGCVLYYALKPQEINADTYAILQRQSAMDEYYFGNDRMVSADYLVKVVSNKTFPTYARTLFDLYDSALQYGTFSVTGFQLVRCVRQTQVEYQDAQKYWHVGGIFRVDLLKV